MKIGAEDFMQILVMDWVRFMQFDGFIFHVANERSCSPHSGAMLKRKGVKSGVSDIAIMRASKGHNGAWIELKSAMGKLSPNQKKFLDDMHNENYFTACCYSAESAIATIKDYLNIT